MSTPEFLTDDGPTCELCGGTIWSYSHDIGWSDDLEIVANCGGCRNQFVFTTPTRLADIQSVKRAHHDALARCEFEATDDRLGRGAR